MPEPWLYLQAMGAAAVVGALCVLAMAGVRRPASSARLNLACVLAMGLGLAAGCYVMNLKLAWPAVNALDRFFTIVVPAILGIELIAGFHRVPRRVAWFLRMTLAATIPRILLHGSVYLGGSSGDWSLWQAGAGMPVCGVLLAAVWALLAWLHQRTPGASIPQALCLSTLCAGITVMMAGYIKGGAAACPLAAAFAATTIGARLVAKRSAVPAIVGIGVAGLFGLLFIGRFFGRLSTASALAMLLAPLLCWATEIPLLRHRKPWIVGSLRLVLVAIPLVAVLIVAKRNFDQNMAPLLNPKPAATARRIASPMLSQADRSPPGIHSKRGRIYAT